MLARGQSNIKEIELAPGRFLRPDTGSRPTLTPDARAAVAELKAKACA